MANCIKRDKLNPLNDITKLFCLYDELKTSVDGGGSELWTDSGTTLSPLTAGRNISTTGSGSFNTLRSNNNDVIFESGGSGFRFSNQRLAFYGTDTRISSMDAGLVNEHSAIHFIAGANGSVSLRQNGVARFTMSNTDGSLTATAPILTNSDIEITDSTKGIIMKSPDGTRYRVTVANGGTLTVTAL